MTPENQIQRLRGSIERWRRSRKSLETMPRESWETATQLAAQLGVGVVARTLKIDHGKLKRLTDRLSSAGTSVPSPACSPPSGPTFLEISTAALVSNRPDAQTMSCQLEVETGPARLRAQLENVSAHDVATIFREFVK